MIDDCCAVGARRMRVLDELADALHAARGHALPRPIQSSIRLEDQFDRSITATRWDAAARRLGCPLPALEFDQGYWWLPDDLVTIWDLAAVVGRYRPDWGPPAEQSEPAWWDAQVFVGVRQALADAGNLDLAEVVRSARVRVDLGF